MHSLQDWERGKIINRFRAQQQIDFSGVRIPGTRITPTDVDGLIEYKDRAWVGIEIKNAGEPIQPGQRIAFERMVQDLHSTGKPVIWIVADHYTREITEDAEAAKAVVRCWDLNGTGWQECIDGTTVKEMVADFLKMVDETTKNGQ